MEGPRIIPGIDGIGFDSTGFGDAGFDDGKDPEALRTIGEVSRALDIRQHVLRYWEEQFPALRPVKRSGGRRYYRARDIALIVEIDQLVHREGYTLRGARKAIAEKAVKDEPVSTVNEAGHPSAKAVGVGEDIRRKLVDIRRQLAEALAAA
ncbi:DNA-binding transcriptional regulator, MerR family [Novosphingobium sp. CF614]|uniref:MerR family transcriptional regulator n=1 Tax=Novosphingobium sp. CF614 TaxID=1884364 RepID=UPI0008E16158|nr:MerR family transcriptional regulator [Novosphingobium sp. CF614]SFF99686.1 DNA-binding transcriptional regulator, MerR family [Novosphingobium sp. CF614]